MTGNLSSAHLNHFLKELNLNRSLNPQIHPIEMTHIFTSVEVVVSAPFTSHLNLWMKP